MDNKQIIDDIRSGNKESIKTVYQSYAKDIYNFSKSITGSHDSAMEATKKTFINLFTNIQNGETPDDVRLAALKIAYAESCAIVMPEKKAENASTADAEPAAAQKGKVVGDDIIDTPEEFETVMNESDSEAEASSWKDEPNEADFPDEKIAPAEGDSESEVSDIGNTQVFNISGMDYNQDGDLVIDENEEVSEEKAIETEIDTKLGSEEDEEQAKPRKKGVTALIIIINIILILILLWLLYGLLVNFGVLPQIADLGYTWFNQTIYPLF